MMLAEDQRNWLSEESTVDLDMDFELGPSMDINDLWRLIEEKNPDPCTNTTQQRMPEELLSNDMGQGYSDLERSSASRAQFIGHIGVSPSYNSEASDSRTGVSDGSSDSAGNSIVDGMKLGFQGTASPVHSFSGSLTDWMPLQDNDRSCLDKDNIFRRTSSNVQEERLLQSQFTAENELKTSEMLAVEETSSMGVAVSSSDEPYSRFSLCQMSDPYTENWDKYSQASHTGYFVKQDAPHNLDFEMLSHCGNMLNVLDEQLDHASGYGDSDMGMAYENCTTRSDEGFQQAPKCSMTANFGVGVLGDFSSYYHGDNQKSLSSGILFSGLTDNNAGPMMFSQPLPCSQSSSIFQKQELHRRNVKNELIGGADISTVSELSNSLCPAPVTTRDNLLVYPRGEDDVLEYDGPCSHLGNFVQASIVKNILVPHNNHLDVEDRERPISMSSTLRKLHFSNAKLGKGEMRKFVKVTGSRLSAITHRGIQRNLLPQRSHSENDDDDDDLCILEDISAPAKANPCANGKPPVALQRTTITDSFPPVEVGHGQMRAKSNDEHVIFQVALQDLSQPKSEESPPDGLLAVPLLRHQRIALSWMVKKEKAGIPCCGGILADDQGLGKTVSTIALILKERAPSLTVPTVSTIKTETETLNLDDDDVPSELGKLKQGADSCQVNESPSMGGKTSLLAKGRPAAGTLVVCPTSVLRQWSEELHNKVTRKANLSVLVYHGGNRTKDPIELAKYDVVVTTYSIVSMEVPKQPLVEEDDETGKGTHESPIAFSSKKRKSPSSSKKSSSKAKKEVEKELLEATARPLARVGWYRVVLDEAQSIKNYRTQVARACWGLRAKRRWCLSGTPIQNAVDDLYSYFRFLKYDPYAVYKQFISTIKVPIQRHPTTGYRKLQAVLKTVMLRRTKGTFIDGEPIINLPPKRIVLRKVDFTEEERDFYCRLEADSRAQFAEYAAAGTVKQNYVNILLMLLRLRQACDHPLLVGGSNSVSVRRSSIEEANKLPREKLADLLNCLEASLAICGICNDPPEDAVVTVCGHVFCNQCICEHLTGDDAKCPVAACKTQLTVSSVFSKAMLSGSLSDQPSLQKNLDYTGSGEAENPIFSPYDSSKIKAALEVLQSLSKPKDGCTGKGCVSGSDDGCASPSENTCDNHSAECRLSGGSEDTPTVVGEKAIVFSQWTGMLDLLEACLKSSSIQYRRLDGTMSVLARDKAVKDFNTLPEISVIIMSLKAASLGLNMVAACHVLLLDLWWNPTTEDQAIDRAHRIGQTRPVTVLRLTVKDTVEDRILALQQKKREMVASAFGEDETGSRQTRLTVEDLEYLFKI